MLPTYQNISAEHLRAFARWINLCVVVGTILAAGFGAMALAGGNSGRSELAARIEPAAYTAAEKRPERSGTQLGYQTVY